MTNKGEMGQPHDLHDSPRRSLDDGPPLKKSKALPARYSDEEEREERQEHQERQEHLLLLRGQLALRTLRRSI